ncbi:MAG: DUF983 domain-containing protein [Micavibrio sp.]|nr:DUF983 domain-containing protein [Micavibrio sp.]
MKPDKDLLAVGWRCVCPACKTGEIYKSSYSINLRARCDNCELDLSKGDAADGPAVFLIFILGFMLVPLALLVEFSFSPPLWLHVILWGFTALLITIGALRPVKAYVLALQYKHRADMFQ